jgi:PAS domain S-box-containing protein
MIDSTPQRIREARLRSLLALSSTAMIVIDADRRIVDANAAASEVVGASRDEILVRRVDDFTATEGGFSVDAIWNRLMRDGRLNGAYPLRRLDGEVRPVVFAATANVLPGRHMSVFAPGAAQCRDPLSPAPNGDSVLTPREREVLRLIADGLTDRQIADSLAVAPATARTHTRNLLEKLGSRTRAQAVAVAVRRGEIAL